MKTSILNEQKTDGLSSVNYMHSVQCKLAKIYGVPETFYLEIMKDETKAITKLYISKGNEHHLL